ncbi:hypothetical protein [Cellulomonas oligotrophica]|uniref:Uncharacterized protein n=1 Tax=Cellulomonas oligotrophica TaxID=931536 RepID=A0A7Y9FCE5_9CELL|nr:hypothetical protein [Cellulomonas oligotrophica]NYD84477.1 hypothetical protein [Cellulomonas oligotrophica]GIG33881.1 hypothetical protein Col01nite_30400 [Cellulomonas oligotrophica]
MHGPPPSFPPTPPGQPAAGTPGAPAGGPAPSVPPGGGPVPVALHDVEARDPGARRTSRPRSRATVVLAVVLVAVLVGAGVLGTHLWRTTQAWGEAAADWERLAREHGEELAQSRADLDATSAELAGVQAQLANAQSRITSLADEKAQLGDTSAATQQLADYQARVSQAAGQVATALASCIEGQEQLIGYLREQEQYDAQELAGFEADVDEVCGAATEANDSLQAELTR